MKLKVADLYDLSLGLGDLAQKELPISLSFKIQRIQKTVSEELVSSDKVRQKTAEKYKEKVLESGHVKIKKDKMDDFKKEMDELMSQEIEVDIEKIDIKTLENANINIKPQTLMQLESILDAE